MPTTTTGEQTVAGAGPLEIEPTEIEPTEIAPTEMARGSAGASPPTFAELYADQFLPLVRTATLLVGRTEVARDIVQDAFVKLHVKWLGVRDPGAYVRRSVVNGCRSHLRWERRRRGQRSDLEPSEDAAVDHTLSALAVLSPVQRAVIVLKFYEGRTEAEIAQLVGCRPGSVGPTVQRALASLREALV